MQISVNGNFSGFNLDIFMDFKRGICRRKLKSKWYNVYIFRYRYVDSIPVPRNFEKSNIDGIWSRARPE